MTAAHPAGATSHEMHDRRPVDRARVDHVVRRLQTRIVKAAREGRPGKVRALQWLLTHSFSGRVLAVARAAEAPDGRIAGVDGEHWPTAATRALAVRRLRRRGYHPAPLRRITVMQRDGTSIRRAVPTLHDRAMLWLQRLALEPVVGDPSARRDRAAVIARVHAHLAAHRQLRWVLVGDLSAGMAHLSPQWLAHAPLDPVLQRAWLRSGHLLGNPSRGVAADAMPGIIAPLLIDLLLGTIARQLRHAAPAPVEGHHADHVLIGHQGQFVVASTSRHVLEAAVLPLVWQSLGDCGIAPDRANLTIRPISAGFEVLGLHVRRTRSRLVVRPANTSMHRMLTQVRALVRLNRGSSAGRLVQVLNPLLRDWVQQHRYVTGKRAFADIDHALSQLLWRWARRRHPNKSRGWVFARYFRRADGTHGFHGDHAGRDVTLYRARATIVVHPGGARPGQLRRDERCTASSWHAGTPLPIDAASPSGAFARPEPDDRQRSRPVLRGGATGDAGSLPDSKRRCGSIVQQSSSCITCDVQASRAIARRPQG